jgi:uncharacterized protein
MLAPAVYEGTIAHSRRAVRANRFRHRIALAYVDLTNPPARLTRGRFQRFRREDYLGEAAVRDLVADETGVRPSGPIGVLTNLRTLGRVMNPVSFFYCFDPSGERVEAVVAEVTNTPWGERHAYVLSDDPAPKQLHVSPFFGMDQHYRWTADAPGERLRVHIANHEGAERVFDAELAVRRRPMTAETLRHQAFSALRVGILIYAHALALKVKGVPLHRHP